MDLWQNGALIMSIKKPSLFRILTIDFFSFATFIFPFIAWAVFGVASYLDGRIPAGIPWLAVSFTVGMFLLCAWRVRLIWSTLEEGVDVPGKIINIFFYKDRGRVDYSYTYQGEVCRRKNVVMKCKRTQALIPDSDIMIAVNPFKPTMAFIRSLYSSS